MNNILITGIPGSGKTTLVRRLVESLSDRRPVGFYTQEVREQGTRTGFDIISLDGRRRRLAHTSMRGGHRIGKYGVDVPGFEEFLATTDFFSDEAGFAVIDEIGRMECLSPAFIRLTKDLLDAKTLLVAAVSIVGGGFIREVKDRKDAEIVVIDPRTREAALESLCRRLRGSP